jgi:hypothetical protein
LLAQLSKLLCQQLDVRAGLGCDPRSHDLQRCRAHRLLLGQQCAVVCLLIVAKGNENKPKSKKNQKKTKTQNNNKSNQTDKLTQTPKQTTNTTRSPALTLVVPSLSSVPAICCVRVVTVVHAG